MNSYLEVVVLVVAAGTAASEIRQALTAGLVEVLLFMIDLLVARSVLVEVVEDLPVERLAEVVVVVVEKELEGVTVAEAAAEVVQVDMAAEVLKARELHLDRQLGDLRLCLLRLRLGLRGMGMRKIWLLVKAIWLLMKTRGQLRAVQALGGTS